MFLPMSLREYLIATRQPRYSILFALPLLLLYEALAALISHSAFSGVRNGADVLLKTLFVSFGGRMGLLTFGLLLFGLAGYLVVRDQRKHGQRLQPRVFAGMFAESLLYAALLGSVVSLLTAWLLQGHLMIVQGAVERLSIGTQLVISLGAGLYEELLFRVLLVTALVALGKYLGWKQPVAISVAIVGSALIFSGFHYIGPLGDQLTLPSFTFRAVAGLLLSGLYVARGFGITAWTHALYDVAVTLAATG
jgi:membrane protease YdiL (CAAX protease family)